MSAMRAFMTLLREFVATHHPELRRFFKASCVIVFAAIVLEAAVFNFNHWRSMAWQTVTLDSQIDLPEAADGRYRVSTVDNDIEFEHLGVCLLYTSRCV